MNRTEEQLTPGFKRSQASSINGNRTRHVIRFNREKASPEETIIIDIPKLEKDSCLIPGSMHLNFDLKVSTTKPYFLNNLSKLLKKKLLITISTKTVHDNNNESLNRVYEDLYKSNSQRDNMVEYGIGSENLRKLISKDDSGATSGNETKVSEKLLFNIYGTKQKIGSDEIIRDHGLYTPFDMKNSFRYSIKLPESKDVLVAQSGQTRGEYTLENLELEYETIKNQSIPNEISSIYSVRRSFRYDHIVHHTGEEWSASSTIQNFFINVTNVSLKAIVLFFH